MSSTLFVGKWQLSSCYESKTHVSHSVTATEEGRCTHSSALFSMNININITNF